MPGKVTFKVEGLREIEAALKELGVSAANRVARSALNRSVTPAVKRAKELVPVDTGELRKSITKRLRRQRRGSDRQTIFIGVERPRSRLTHLLEFGGHAGAATAGRSGRDPAPVCRSAPDRPGLGLDMDGLAQAQGRALAQTRQQHAMEQQRIALERRSLELTLQSFTAPNQLARDLNAVNLQFISLGEQARALGVPFRLVTEAAQAARAAARQADRERRAQEQAAAAAAKLAREQAAAERARARAEPPSSNSSC